MEYPLYGPEYRQELRRVAESRPVSEKPTSELLAKIAGEHKLGLLTDDEYITRTTMVCFDYAVEQHGSGAQAA